MLTQFKSYKAGFDSSVSTDYLCHPSKIIFQLLAKCEIVIRSSRCCLLRNECPNQEVLSKIEYNTSSFSKCHDLPLRILKR